MKYLEKKIAITLILIAALNTATSGLYNINIIDLIIKNNSLGKKIYNILIIGAVIWSVLNLYRRDQMLPFLGKAVYPCGSLKEQLPLNYTNQIDIKVTPNSKVIYWAAEPKDDNEVDDDGTYKSAYKNYSNNGVVVSDKDGNVTLKFRSPREYTVPRKGLLKPHVHYRVCNGGGMMSKVFTEYL